MIIARAQAAGSTATTAKGAAKYLTSRAIHAKDEPRYSMDQYKVHAALDAGKPGDKIVIPARSTTARRIHGYFCCVCPDKAAREASKAAAHANNPRKKNLYTGQARISGPAYQEREETINYKGAFKGWRGSEIFADYQSCLCVSRSGSTAVQVTGNVFVRRFRAPEGMAFARAPEGMAFAHDSNGVLLRRVSDGMDYHPTYEDWRAPNFATVIRKAMADNFRKRAAVRKMERQAKRDKIETARIEAIKVREIGNVRVTLEDSRLSGNCVEGSLAYAERKLGLTRDEIISGGYLFSVPACRVLAANDKVGARRAVDVAWMRETTVSI